jgi:hypothetical protein
MSRKDELVSKVLRFYESPEGHEFWKQNRDEKGMCWEDNVVNLCLKAAFPESIEELESVLWKVRDILIERGIVKIAA